MHFNKYLNSSRNAPRNKLINERNVKKNSESSSNGLQQRTFTDKYKNIRRIDEFLDDLDSMFLLNKDN